MSSLWFGGRVPPVARSEAVEARPSPKAELDLWLRPEVGQPIPPGWFETKFVPAVAATIDVEALQEAEHRIKALVAYFDREKADKATLVAAQRAANLTIHGTRQQRS